MRHTLFFLVFLAAANICLQPVAHAQTSSFQSYECNLDGSNAAGLSPCLSSLPGGVPINAAIGNGTCQGSDPYCAARASGRAQVPIDAWNICRWVDTTNGDAIFVPFKTGSGVNSEWQQFLTNHPSYVNLVHCALPYSVNDIANPTSAISPPWASCDSATVNNPNIYGRAPFQNQPATIYAPPGPYPTFTCHDGLTVTSKAQWIAMDSEPNNGPRLMNTLTWQNAYQYSPDITLTANGQPDTVAVNQGAQVDINWSTNPAGATCVPINADDWTQTASMPGAPLPDGSSGDYYVSPTTTTTYELACTGANKLQSTISVTVTINPPTNGVCGSTVNGQTLSSAPSGAELCNSGTPINFGGTGPWTWTCQGISGGTDSPICTANLVGPPCPVASINGSATFLTGTDFSNPSVTVNYPGVSTPVVLTPTATNDDQLANAFASYFNGMCAETVSSDGYTVTFSIFGNTESENSWYVGWGSEGGMPGFTLPTSGTATYGGTTIVFHGTTATFDGATIATGGIPVSGTPFGDFISCLATEYARENLNGYANCTATSWSGDTYSPLKVNLAERDAKNNSTTLTNFYLTLQDGRILEGHVKGGLNADEGWLMVKRGKDPLVFENGTLNADDWFGDRDHRMLNGYTDLAETFKSFVTQDGYGKSYIPLHVLKDDEKAQKAAEAQSAGEYKVTEPSFDLRVIDINGEEHFASDYFDRIYVDYRNVVEGDGKDGKSGNNLVLERGIVHTLQGENHGAIDQWFVLDIPADYHDPGHPTQSKVWPASSQPAK